MSIGEELLEELARSGPVIVIDEYLAGGSWPFALPDDEVALQTSPTTATVPDTAPTRMDQEGLRWKL